MLSAYSLPDTVFHFVREEAGASLTEYVLIAALVIVVIKIGMLALSKGA